MNVKEILSVKGRDVVTLEPNASLATAAKVLAEHRIGAVVVTGAAERIVGILSERDIVQVLATRGIPALDMQVSEVMTRKVATCSPHDTISSIMERMTAANSDTCPWSSKAGLPASFRSAMWSSIA